MKYIDVHAHVNFAAYDGDREQVLDRSKQEGVGIINVGTDIESSQRAVGIARSRENVWAIVGMHPIHISESRNDEMETGIKGEGIKKASDFDEARFLVLAKDAKTVAIGECGIDLFHSDESELPKQIEILKKHIAIANEVNKPLMLHVRNGKDTKNQNAYMMTLDILKQFAKVKANFHFFAGSIEDLMAIMEWGGYVSFTGAITFGSNYDKIINMVREDRIMSETDSPYVAPAPNRGKRNEPIYVKEVVKKIASIRGVDEQDMARILANNAKNFFSIDLY